MTISTLSTFSPFKHRVTVHLVLHLLPEIVRSISHRFLYHGICFPHILQLCSPIGGRQVFMRKAQRPQSPDPRDIPPDLCLARAHTASQQSCCWLQDTKLPEFCLFLPRGVASFSNLYKAASLQQLFSELSK